MGKGFFDDPARGEIVNAVVDLVNMEVYGCGPETFEEMVVDALVGLGTEGRGFEGRGLYIRNSFSLRNATPFKCRQYQLYATLGFDWRVRYYCHCYVQWDSMRLQVQNV